MGLTLVTSIFERVSYAVLLAEGRKRNAFAFIAGGVATLALQPLDFLPALAVSFTILVWLVDSASGEHKSLKRDLWSAARIGWWFGFGYFFLSLWWLGAAFISGGDKFVWLMPLGIVVLPAGLAFFMAFGLVLARLLWSSTAFRIAALAFGLGVSEWLRSWLLTGFPWNNFGQVFANHLLLSQSASVIGSEGLGFLAVILFSSPATIATGQTQFARWGFTLFSTLVFLVMFLFAFVRLAPVGGVEIDYQKTKMVPNVHLRLVQPGFSVQGRNEGETGEEILKRLLALSDKVKGANASGITDVTHLFWHEAPLPFVLEKNQQALDDIKKLLGERTVLIAGAVRVEPPNKTNKQPRYFNAMQVITQSGILASYDKIHLVPFGEYVPFSFVLRSLGFSQFVSVLGGFSEGTQRKVLKAPNLPEIAPIICFESIFPHELAKIAEGAGVIVNITNDAWFGATPGPYQHFAQARLRAIEFGKPLIRVANNGISAVIDPYGRVLKMLSLDETDVIDAPLPEALSKTLYLKSNWYSHGLFIFGLLLLSLIGRFLVRR